MSIEIGSAYFTLMPSTKGAVSKINAELSSGVDGSAIGARVGTGIAGGVSSKLGTASVAIGNVLAEGISTAMSGVGDVVSEAVSNVDQMRKYAKTLDFAGLSKDEIQASSTELKRWADETEFELNDAYGLAAKLASNGVRDFVDLTEATGNLTAVAGGSTQEYSLFALALSQVNSAMVLHAQDWNQISSAIPGASGEIIQALVDMNAFTGGAENFRQAMEEGEISASELDAAIEKLGLTEKAEAAAGATDTFVGATANAKAAIVNGFQDIWNAIDDGDRAVTAINDAGSAVGSAVSSVAPAVKDAVSLVGDAVGAFESLPEPVRDAAAKAAALGGALLVLDSKFGVVSKATAVCKAGLGLVGTALGDLKLRATGVQGPLQSTATRVEALSKAASTARTALAGIGGALALTAVAEAVGQVATSEADAKERADELSDIASSAARSFDEMGSADVMPSGLDELHVALTGIVDDASGVVDSAVSGLKEVSSSRAELAAQVSSLDSAVATIDELAGSCDGSAVKERELEAAVKLYNSTTGDSVTVTDRVSGALSKSTGDIEANTRAWEENAKAQADQEAYAETYKNLKELQTQQGTLQSAYEQAAKARDDYASQHHISDSNPDASVSDTSTINSIEPDFFMHGDSWDAYANLKNDAAAAKSELDKCNAAIQASNDSLSKLGSELDGVTPNVSSLEQAFDALGDSDSVARGFVDGLDLDGLAEQLDSIGVTTDELADATEGDMWSIMRAWNDSGGSADALEQKLSELGIGFSDAGAAAQDAGEQAGESAMSWDDLADSLSGAIPTWDEAASKMQSLLESVNSDNVKDVTSEINSLLSDAGISTEKLSQDQVQAAATAVQAGEQTGDAVLQLAADADVLQVNLMSSGEAADALGESMRKVTPSAQEAGEALDRALNDPTKSAKDVASEANDLFDALGLNIDKVDEKWALEARQSQLTGQAIVEKAQATSQANQADEDAAKAAQDAADAYQDQLDALQDIIDAAPGLASVLGVTASEYGDFLASIGVDLDEFNQKWQEVTQLTDPSQGKFSYDDTGYGDYIEGFQTDSGALNNFKDNVQGLWDYARSQTDPEVQRQLEEAAQYIEDQGPEKMGHALQQMYDSGDVTGAFQEFSDNYHAYIDTETEYTKWHAYDGMENAMGYGMDGATEAVQDGAPEVQDAITDTFDTDRAAMHDKGGEAGGAVADGIASGLLDSDGKLNEAATQAADQITGPMDSLTSQMEERGRLAGTNFAYGFEHADFSKELSTGDGGGFGDAFDDLSQQAEDEGREAGGRLVSGIESGVSDSDAVDTGVVLLKIQGVEGGRLPKQVEDAGRYAGGRLIPGIQDGVSQGGSVDMSAVARAMDPAALDETIRSAGAYAGGQLVPGVQEGIDSSAGVGAIDTGVVSASIQGVEGGLLPESVRSAGRYAGEQLIPGVQSGIDEGGSVSTDAVASAVDPTALDSAMHGAGEYAGSRLVAGVQDGIDSAATPGSVSTGAIATAVQGVEGGLLPQQMHDAGQAAGERLIPGINDGIAGSATAGAVDVSPALSGVADACDAAGTEVGNRLASSLAASLSGVSDAMGGIGGSAGEYFANGVALNSGNVSDAGGQLEDALASALGNVPYEMSLTGTTAGSDFAGGIGQAWQATHDAAASLVSAAAQGIGVDFGWATTSGERLGNNFASGIRSQVGAVASAASEVAQAASDPLHHSTPKVGPLRHDDRWGYELGGNFAHGIQKCVPDVSRAVANLAGAATVDASATFGADVAESLTAPGTVNNVYVGDVNSRPEIMRLCEEFAEGVIRKMGVA